MSVNKYDPINKTLIPMAGVPQQAIDAATTAQYSATIAVADWSAISGGTGYTARVTIPNLTCGKAGNVSPLISFSSNQEEYSKIGSADATPKTASTDGYIDFYIEEIPSEAIGVIIVDQH